MTPAKASMMPNKPIRWKYATSLYASGPDGRTKRNIEMTYNPETSKSTPITRKRVLNSSMKRLELDIVSISSKVIAKQTLGGFGNPWIQNPIQEPDVSDLPLN